MHPATEWNILPLATCDALEEFVLSIPLYIGSVRELQQLQDVTELILSQTPPAITKLTLRFGATLASVMRVRGLLRPKTWLAINRALQRCTHLEELIIELEGFVAGGHYKPEPMEIPREDVQWISERLPFLPREYHAYDRDQMNDKIADAVKITMTGHVEVRDVYWQYARNE